MPNLPRHLHLSLALEVAQLHDRFSRGSGGHRLPELSPLIQLSSPSGVAHLIDDIHGVAAVGVERLLEAEGLHHRLQRRRLPPGGTARPAGRSRSRWLPAQLLSASRPCMALVGRIRSDCGSDPQGVVVPQKAPDLADDHQDAVGGGNRTFWAGSKLSMALMSPMQAYLKQVVRFSPRWANRCTTLSTSRRLPSIMLLAGGGLALPAPGQQLPLCAALSAQA